MSLYSLKSGWLPNQSSSRLTSALYFGFAAVVTLIGFAILMTLFPEQRIDLFGSKFDVFDLRLVLMAVPIAAFWGGLLGSKIVTGEMNRGQVRSRGISVVVFSYLTFCLVLALSSVRSEIFQSEPPRYPHVIFTVVFIWYSAALNGLIYAGWIALILGIKAATLLHQSAVRLNKKAP